MPGVIDWLFDHGADINQTDSSRLDRGFPLNGSWDYSVHVLSRVAAKGDIAFFDHLVSRGADPSRSFALHCASKNTDTTGAVAMIRHLLDKYNLDIEAHKDIFRHIPHGLGS